MGVERPASSFFFHRTLLPSPPSGFHFSTSPFSVETRFCCGPRQFGQSSGSFVASCCAAASGSTPIIVNRRLAQMLERRLIRALRLRIRKTDQKPRGKRTSYPAVKLYRNGKEPRPTGCWQRLISRERQDRACGFAHRGVRNAKLTADVGRTAFLTISNTWRMGHSRFSHRQKRQAFTILRGVQTQPNS